MIQVMCTACPMRLTQRKWWCKVISADLPILAQAELNSNLYFESISWEEAVEARRRQAVFLQKIKVGIVPTFLF